MELGVTECDRCPPLCPMLSEGIEKALCGEWNAWCGCWSGGVDTIVGSIPIISMLCVKIYSNKININFFNFQFS